MSAKIQTSSPTIHRLAEQLEEDIRHRRLDAGEPYLSTVEAAKLLGVSATTAHRALKLLADRGLIVRKPQLGSFVGRACAAKHGSRIRSVYILVPWGVSAPEDMSRDTLLVLNGIRSHIQDCAIQFVFLPEFDSLRYVKKLVDSIKETEKAAGLLPISCPQGIYSYVAGLGLPVVVIGTLYLGDPEIPSVDTDNREAGRMLLQYLIDRGHSHIAVLRGHGHRPGDDDFQDGLSQALTSAGLPPNAMITRSLPFEPKAFVAATRSLLEQAEPPTGFITRVTPFAKTITSAAAKLGYKVPDDIEVVAQGSLTTEAKDLPCPTVRSQWPFRDVAKRIIMMLEAPALDGQRVIVPVEWAKHDTK